ncbi:hypothetical protein DYY67_1589 [Candidatus Nitrosotalea sp. TS]|nr:hypothetical protein [Candidatus Nitrosotalea sp. TS]
MRDRVLEKNKQIRYGHGVFFNRYLVRRERSLGTTKKFDCYHGLET